MTTETTSIGIDAATLTPAQAEARLNELTANTEAGRAWSAKWLGGDPATVAEFKGLVEAKNAKAAGSSALDQIITGTAELPLVDSHSGGTLTVRNQMLVSESLRELGVSHGAIRALFEGEKVDEPTWQAVEELRAQLLGDPEFVKRLLAGGREERKKMALIGIIRVGGKKAA